MGETRVTFHWQEAYARLEQMRRSLAVGDAVSPADVRRILQERAQELARPLEDTHTATQMLDLVVCALAGARYGMAMAHVLEVIPLRELTPVPGAPPFVVGVMHHRGNLLPILDLSRLLALAGQDVTQGSRVVAVEVDGMTFGMLVEAVEATLQIAVSEVVPLPATLTDERTPWLQGVTTGMVTVLDMVALAHDPRVVVNEEVL
jgi:purine-binding chemotaxis protein CheW